MVLAVVTNPSSSKRPVQDRDWLQARIADLERDLRVAETGSRSLEQQLRVAVADRDLRLSELHHRVKNNLQVILSLIKLEERHSEQGPGAAVLRRVYGRVEAMAVVHDELRAAARAGTVECSRFIHNLFHDLLDSHREDGVCHRLELDFDPALLRVDAAVTLGLILNEIVANCFKHAFEPGKVGAISVCVRRELDGGLYLMVRDDGRGFSTDFLREEEPTMGLSLIRSLAGQLGGKLYTTNKMGAVVELRLPADVCQAASASNVRTLKT